MRLNGSKNTWSVKVRAKIEVLISFWSVRSPAFIPSYRKFAIVQFQEEKKWTLQPPPKEPRIEPKHPKRKIDYNPRQV